MTSLHPIERQRNWARNCPDWAWKRDDLTGERGIIPWKQTRQAWKRVDLTGERGIISWKQTRQAWERVDLPWERGIKSTQSGHSPALNQDSHAWPAQIRGLDGFSGLQERLEGAWSQDSDVSPSLIRDQDEFPDPPAGLGGAPKPDSPILNPAGAARREAGAGWAREIHLPARRARSFPLCWCFGLAAGGGRLAGFRP